MITSDYTTNNTEVLNDPLGHSIVLTIYDFRQILNFYACCIDIRMCGLLTRDKIVIANYTNNTTGVFSDPHGLPTLSVDSDFCWILNIMHDKQTD